MLISMLVMAIFLVSGFFTANYFFCSERMHVKLMLAITFGNIMMMWLPAIPSFFLGFGTASQLIGIALSVVIAAAAYVLTNDKKLDFKPLLEQKVLFFTLTPIYALTVYLIFTHSFPANAFGGLDCGQSTFGDMAMHLSFITGISEQRVFPPVYTLYAGGARLGYPFLCDSNSSTLYTLSGSLRAAYIVPMLSAALGFFLAVYILFRHVSGDDVKASLATVLFLIGGGFGYSYFFDMHKQNPSALTDIFYKFYVTPTNYTVKNVKWVNVIADMIIPQRATLFGWVVLIPCIYILYRAVFDDKRKYFVPLGILGGVLPLISTHSFLVLVILSAVCFIYAFLQTPDTENVFVYQKHWLIYILIAFVLSAPQLFLFTFQQVSSKGGFLKLHFNWANNDDNYFWFYIKNIGLIYILIIPAFLHASKIKKWFYAGGAVILLLAEFIVFQPNEYDNNKLLFIWYLLSCGLVADYCVEFYMTLKKSGFGGVKYLAAVFIITTNIGGVLTLVREAMSSMELFSGYHVEAAEYIMENTPADALFLTSNNHNNAVASLTGRSIVCGYGSYLYFAGVDYIEYERLARELLENPDLDELRRYGVDYVYISDYERNGYIRTDLDFFRSNLELAYRNGTVEIFKVPEDIN